MLRFVVMDWRSGAEQAALLAQDLERRLLGANRGWQNISTYKGRLVLCAGFGLDHIHELHGHVGFVFGTLFRRQSDSRITDSPFMLTPEEAHKVAATAGRYLISHFWGRYVAVIQDPHTARSWIVRDPSGEFPCFATTFSEVTIFFSCLADLTDIGMHFNPNWDYLANRLIYGTGLADQTGLMDVTEVYQGECIEISRDSRVRHSYWNPFSIASTDVIEDPSAAGEALYATLKSVTHQWASKHRSILHMLSGGLDSSVLLACLVDAPATPRVTCLTYRRREPTEDLRFARLAAKHAGCELIEVFLEDFSPNFEGFLRVIPDPYPLIGGIAGLWMSPCESRLAGDRSATAVTEGNPGDNLLGANDHRFGAIDYAQRHGLSRHLVTYAAMLAPWINTSFWTVLWQAVCAVRPAYNDDPISARRRPTPTLLGARTRQTAAQPQLPTHPWFSKRTRSTRATVMMADALSYPRRYYDAFKSQNLGHPEPLELFKSQPFIEVCLRIPTYVLNAKGRSRGLVRQLFANELPREIVTRFWKDRGGTTPETVLLRNRKFARELLLDGELVRNELLNRAQVEKALSPDVAPGVGDALEVCESVVLESWLRTVPRGVCCPLLAEQPLIRNPLSYQSPISGPASTLPHFTP